MSNTSVVLSGIKVDAVVSAPSGGSSAAVVKLAGGSSISASKGVVVAVEGPEAARLLGQALEVRLERGCRKEGCQNKHDTWGGGRGSECVF